MKRVRIWVGNVVSASDVNSDRVVLRNMINECRILGGRFCFYGKFG